MDYQTYILARRIQDEETLKVSVIVERNDESRQLTGTLILADSYQKDEVTISCPQRVTAIAGEITDITCFYYGIEDMTLLEF